MAEVRNVLLQVTGNSRSGLSALDQIERKLQDLPGSEEINLRVEAGRAIRDLGEMQRKLDTVDRSSVSPEVSVRIGKALADLDALRANVNGLPRKRVIDIELRRDTLRQIAGVKNETTNLVRGLQKATQPTHTFGERLGNVSSTLQKIVPVARGVAVAIGIKLAAGFLAVGASAVSAAGGVGVLGTALLGALGPAVVLAIGLFNRMAKVFEALKAQDAAKDAAARKSAEGTKAAADAAEQRKAAESSLRDALQGVTTADRALADARQQAADDIADAGQASADANRDLRDSAAGVQDAVVDAYLAVAEAAERASDAVLALERAQLALDEADLGVREAQQELADYRKELALAGDAFDGLFKRFTDVDVDIDTKGLSKALKGGGVSEGDSLEVERKILAIRDAKLREREATDGLSDAERELKDARQENQRFQQQGIGAYGPLNEAIRAHADAQRAASDAAAEFARLQRQGVSGAPGVISALDGVRDAHERLAQARREVRRVADSTALSTEQAKAEQLTNKLTASERRFLEVLKQVRTELRGFLAPAVDAVFGAMTRALGRAPQLLNPLRAAFRSLGESWAYVIDRFSQALVTPGAIAAIRALIRGSGQLARILGGDAFISFGRIIGKLAVYAMPLLLDVAQSLAGYLRGVARSMDDVGAVSPIINAMVESFKSWMRLLGAIINLFVSLAGEASGAGDGIIGWLTEGINKFAAFLRSAEGSEMVRDFFEDTVPAVKSMVKTIGLLAVIFLRFLQITAPLLDGMASVLNFVLGLLAGLLGFIADIASNPWGRAIRYAIGQFLAIGGILRVFGYLVSLIGRIPGLLTRVGGGAISYLARPFMAAGRLIIRIFRGLPGLLARLVRGAPAAIARVLRAGWGLLRTAGGKLVAFLVTGVRALLPKVVAAGRFIITRLLGALAAGFLFLTQAGRKLLGWVIGGIRNAVSKLVSAGGWIVNKLWEGIKAAGGFIYDVGKWLLEGLINGFTAVGRAVWDAIKGLAGKIVDAVKSVLGIASPSKVMQGLGEAMLAGLIKGFTSGDVLSFVKDHLGGLPALAAELAKAGLINLPLNIVKGGIDKVGDLVGSIPGLAAGGIVTNRMVAELGERGREAVIPLSRRVMRQLAGALAPQLGSFAAPASAPAGALAAAGAGTFPTIEHQTVNLPPPPAGGSFDARFAAQQYAKELARRGRGGSG